MYSTNALGGDSVVHAKLLLLSSTKLVQAVLKLGSHNVSRLHRGRRPALLTAEWTAGRLTGPKPSEESWGGLRSLQSAESTFELSSFPSAYGSTWARQPHGGKRASACAVSSFLNVSQGQGEGRYVIVETRKKPT